MVKHKNPEDIDIYALLAEVHGNSAEDLRDGRVADALNTLEATHRDAARGLRELHTQGLRRARGTDGAGLSASRALPAHLAQAGDPKTSAEPSSVPAPAVATDTAKDASADDSKTMVNIAVQSGEGADVQLDHRTLTHIVRPNRGRR